MAESVGERKLRAQKILKQLEVSYPIAECALVHKNPFELVVATILSAQCTDQRVNMVTPALFEAYPTPEALKQASLEEIETLIQSTGFFRAKARSLSGLAHALVDHHQGVVPQTIEELVALPGVGRKTANVVLGVAFGIAKGVVVDTHVRRISTLLGLTKSSNVEVIERDLMKLLPRDSWIDYSHRIIHHGRKICIARRPKCTECPLLAYCQRVGLPKLLN
ncbi:endonuclease III [Planctomicrobium sp. SH527]|uniref:endonuclease III n=1 Tax=Planctomicrobium sp. SH527 TaxID=3448123 RepID=UPI003F5B466C